MGNRFGRRRYHANECFNHESSVDDRALRRAILFLNFFISVCTDQFVLVGASLFFQRVKLSGPGL